MVSMKMSAEERSEYNDSVMAEQPVYPYGLRISLDDDALEKLNMPALPQIDSTMIITCKVQVVGVRSYQESNGDKEDCVDLQITEMEIGPDNSSKSMAEKIYGA